MSEDPTIRPIRAACIYLTMTAPSRSSGPSTTSHVPPTGSRAIACVARSGRARRLATPTWPGPCSETARSGSMPCKATGSAPSCSACSWSRTGCRPKRSSGKSGRTATGSRGRPSTALEVVELGDLLNRHATAGIELPDRPRSRIRVAAGDRIDARVQRHPSAQPAAAHRYHIARPARCDLVRLVANRRSDFPDVAVRIEERRRAHRPTDLSCRPATISTPRSTRSVQTASASSTQTVSSNDAPAAAGGTGPSSSSTAAPRLRRFKIRLSNLNATELSSSKSTLGLEHTGIERLRPLRVVDEQRDRADRLQRFSSSVGAFPSGQSREHRTAGDPRPALWHSEPMVPESELITTEHGRVPKGQGWFVLNAREAQWWEREGRGVLCEFEGAGFEGATDFEQLGVNLTDSRPRRADGDVPPGERPGGLPRARRRGTCASSRAKSARCGSGTSCTARAGTEHVIVGAGERAVRDPLRRRPRPLGRARTGAPTPSTRPRCATARASSARRPSRGRRMPASPRAG